MNAAFQQDQTERMEREGGQPSVCAGPTHWPSSARDAGDGHGKTGVWRWMHRHFAGQVTRTVLLTRLLPLSFVSLFGALFVAALFYPTAFDWRVRVISALTSPYTNPRGCWLAAFGVMAAMVLILPFAGYSATRLRAIAPQPARPAGVGFGLGFILTFLTVGLQLMQPLIGLRWLHGLLGGLAAGSFIAGIFCGCACAIQDLRRGPSQPKCLSTALAWSWLALILGPAACLIGIGAVLLLGQHAGVTWAEDFRQSFQQTALWHLAFWEWIGVGLAYVFMACSVFLLPRSDGERSPRSGRDSLPAEASLDSLSREPSRAL